jgi:hypothetical protein
MLFIAATSWCRHETKAPSPSRHRYRLRVVRINKKSMPDKTPAPAFSLPHTTLSAEVRHGRCALCFLSPLAQQVRLCGVALRCSFPRSHLPRFPSAPRGSLKIECRFFRASAQSCPAFPPFECLIDTHDVRLARAGVHKCASAFPWACEGRDRTCWLNRQAACVWLVRGVMRGRQHPRAGSNTRGRRNVGKRSNGLRNRVSLRAAHSRDRGRGTRCARRQTGRACE